jgi:hypothetical protein
MSRTVRLSSFQSMGYAERVELHNADPEAYQRLVDAGIPSTSEKDGEVEVREAPEAPPGTGYVPLNVRRMSNWAQQNPELVARSRDLGPGAEPVKASELTVDQFGEMSYEERCQLHAVDRQAYQRLADEAAGIRRPIRAEE